MDDPKDSKTEAENKKRENRTTLWLCIIGTIVILLIAWPHIFSGKPVLKTQDTLKPNEVWFTLTDTNWQGISNYDPKMKIVGTIKTLGVWWQIKLDEDETQVYTLSPAPPEGSTNRWQMIVSKDGTMTYANLPSSGTNTIILPDSNKNQWRVLPGQPIKQARMVARIVPR